ncbi:fatty acid desaturase [Rhizobium rhizogenes]|uniref:fatty acid desaturase n=1 Tax=Rhizobium rhizogenes TaxID=359 RepID=UPI0015716ED7|nr:fatty acid desaturase [Rhizobium rhizogenes]NTF45906.1 fatty acid desaturase [Rhizobium rhizogenes]
MADSHIVRHLSERKSVPAVEWPTLFLLVGCHLIWLMIGVFLYPVLPNVSLILLGICIAFHSSLQHEVLHGHPFRNERLNELLVFLPIGLFYPYRSYRDTHLQHHTDERLTDPYDDPESYYRTLGDWLNLPRAFQFLLTINNTLIGRMLLGPPLNVIGFTISEWRLIAAGNRQKRTAWIMHFIGLVPVGLAIHFLFAMPIWFYALTVGYLGLALVAIRSYCEHQWSEDPDGRTIIVERSLLAPLFLYNNLHIVHHKLPWVPWYRLPELYETTREEWQRVNGGYVFPSYLAILRAYGLKPKEQVAHPALHREVLLDRAVTPQALEKLESQIS